MISCHCHSTWRRVLGPDEAARHVEEGRVVVDVLQLDLEFNEALAALGTARRHVLQRKAILQEEYKRIRSWSLRIIG